MKEPDWLQRFVIDLIHEDQIQQHGGRPGVHDETLIESALARPKSKYAYDQDVDTADLAAAYGYGLATNHGFVDGNKRVAFMAVYTFLAMNGYDFDAPEPEVVVVMRDLAAGDLTESEFAEWIRLHMRSVQD